MLFSNLTPDRLISQPFVCDCGKTHAALGIQSIVVGRGVLPKLIDVLRELSIKKPFLVTDANEYEAAGRRVEALLRENSVPFTTHIIPCEAGGRIAPSEFAQGSIVLNYDRSCDAILCVGSGVMNDLCKMISNISGLPEVVVATAPSMDGYASDTAAMEVNQVKLSLKARLPAALICDVDILSQAPMRMLQAGLGDMLGKFSALCEWKLAHLIRGEEYCPEIERLVRVSLDRITSGARGVKERDPEAITAITEGLILSGIAMAFAGLSRPASGLEHYFSHCWEMAALARGEESDLHGIQVGVGTLLVLKIYERLKTLKPTMERVEAAADAFDPIAWEQNLRRVFGATAEQFVVMEQTAQKNEKSGRMKRAETTISNWDTVLKIAETAPSFAEIEALMKAIGMPTTPEEIGIGKQETVDAFICSRDVRDKFQLSSMLWDIGYMEEIAAWLKQEL